MIITIKNQPITIHKRVSLRARRLSLRLKNNTFELVSPPLASDNQIQRFLKQCIPWIEKQWAKVQPAANQWDPSKPLVLNGVSIPCHTDPLRRKPVLCKATQTLRLPTRFQQEDLHAFLKEHARLTLTPYVTNAAKALGQSLGRLTFRDQTSRWGSCSSSKNISLSWRLILAPPEVAYYVCVHEVAHLIHMNHSAAFWAVVASLCPDFKAHRKWLRTHGKTLGSMV